MALHTTILLSEKPRRLQWGGRARYRLATLGKRKKSNATWFYDTLWACLADKADREEFETPDDLAAEIEDKTKNKTRTEDYLNALTQAIELEEKPTEAKKTTAEPSPSPASSSA